MADNILPFPSRGWRRPPSTLSSSERADWSRVVDALKALEAPPDDAFDRFLPEPMRSLSAQHWTPLAVVARAAQWLDECNVRTVVDIGSGAGKFCVAAALAGRCHLTGVEHRSALVAASRELASTFGVGDRTSFIHGALGEVPLPRADAYYLYNPFEENVRPSSEHIDASIELGGDRSSRDIAAVQSLLASTPSGTYVLVYGGFGGCLPAAYRRIRTDLTLRNPLCLWRKSGARTMSRARPMNAAACMGAA
jgi:SAM-dependent methyltransferase